MLGRISISRSWLSRTSASFMGVREMFSSAAIRVSEYSTLGWSCPASTLSRMSGDFSTTVDLLPMVSLRSVKSESEEQGRR